MAFCDGAVKLMRYIIDPTIHMQLGHRSDGEPTNQEGLYEVVDACPALREIHNVGSQTIIVSPDSCPPG